MQEIAQAICYISRHHRPHHRVHSVDEVIPGVQDFAFNARHDERRYGGGELFMLLDLYVAQGQCDDVRDALLKPVVRADAFVMSCDKLLDFRKETAFFAE